MLNISPRPTRILATVTRKSVNYVVYNNKFVHGSDGVTKKSCPIFVRTWYQNFISKHVTSSGFELQSIL